MQILQMQTDAGLAPGTSLSETLDHLLCPDSQPDGPMADQASPYDSQQVRQHLRMVIYCRDPYHPRIKSLRPFNRSLPGTRRCGFVDKIHPLCYANIDTA